MASREEVTYAYRYLLGREPEDESTVLEYTESVSDWKALRNVFMSSDEYAAQGGCVSTTRPPAVSLCAPPMCVDVDAPPAKLEQLFAVTCAQWSHLGETEPHWSVLTQDQFLREQLGQRHEEFYASGAFEIRMLESALARADIESRSFSSCLEFGCGVGRVTMHLASRFATVTGVDISASHLELATKHIQRQGISNVLLRRLNSLGEVASLGNFDVVFCRMVLQHNTPPVMAHLLRQLLQLLNPGGVALIQIPTYRSGYEFRIDEYLASPDLQSFETHYFPQPALLRIITESNCQVREIKEDDSIGRPIESISNSLLIQKPGEQD